LDLWVIATTSRYANSATGSLAFMHGCLKTALAHPSWATGGLSSVALQRCDDGGMSRLDRITSDPVVCHGQPTVRGLRYPAESLLELLSAGMTIDEVLVDYPDLERDDLLAAVEFGALVAGRHRVIPLGAA
jgi:uncharacterized protein (DUF433 family)